MLEVVKHKDIHHSRFLFIVFQDGKTGSIVIHSKDSDKHPGVLNDCHVSSLSRCSKTEDVET